MTEPQVLVLGGSGMLGAMVTDYLSKQPGLSVSATLRCQALAAAAREQLPGVVWRLYDAEDQSSNLSFVAEYDWVVNCIGITKPLIHDDNVAEVRRAAIVNSLLPCALQHAIAGARTRVIQIATDCVYSGAKGSYLEADPHDALDAYGKTKSLGETPGERYYHLRCSIIGPEPKERKFLLEWFLSQPQGGEVKGFTNHEWNGVTTLHFAKLCQGLITGDVAVARTQHVVPGDRVTKCAMLGLFASCFGREDIRIVSTEAGTRVDRTLSTSSPDVNSALWAAAGYDEAPTIGRMLTELAGYRLCLKWG